MEILVPSGCKLRTTCIPGFLPLLLFKKIAFTFFSLFASFYVGLRTSPGSLTYKYPVIWRCTVPCSGSVYLPAYWDREV